MAPARGAGAERLDRAADFRPAQKRRRVQELPAGVAGVQGIRGRRGAGRFSAALGMSWQSTGPWPLRHPPVLFGCFVDACTTQTVRVSSSTRYQIRPPPVTSTAIAADLARRTCQWRVRPSDGGDASFGQWEPARCAWSPTPVPYYGEPADTDHPNPLLHRSSRPSVPTDHHLQVARHDPPAWLGSFPPRWDETKPRCRAG